MPRQWTLTIRPLRDMTWLSMNPTSGKWARAQMIAQWRALAAQTARKARLPRGLEHVRIDAVITPRVVRKRDRPNFQATLKPIVDGLAGQAHSGAPAYGLIPDDDPVHLDGPHLTIGAPHPLGSRLPFVGLVELTITELNGHTPER